MKLDIKKIAPFVFAAVSAGMAFMSEMGNQQKEKTIKDLKDATADLLDRVSKLENK